MWTHLSNLSSLPSSFIIPVVSHQYSVITSHSKELFMSNAYVTNVPFPYGVCTSSLPSRQKLVSEGVVQGLRHPSDHMMASLPPWYHRYGYMVYSVIRLSGQYRVKQIALPPLGWNQLVPPSNCWSKSIIPPYSTNLSTNPSQLLISHYPHSLDHSLTCIHCLSPLFGYHTART